MLHNSDYIGTMLYNFFCQLELLGQAQFSGDRVDVGRQCDRLLDRRDGAVGVLQAVAGQGADDRGPVRQLPLLRSR